MTTWRDWTPEAKRALLDRAAAELARRRRATWAPYPWQVPPGPLPAHHMWLLMGGRGTGKTDAGSHYVLDHVTGPPCDPRIKGGHRVAIVAPTLGDAVESCVRGVSGLQAIDPRVRLTGRAGGTFVVFPSGSEAKLFGAHTEADVDRLRAGGNRCLVWLEEAAAMRYLGPALEHTRLGLRVGQRPHLVATTTPKPRPEVVGLVRDTARTHVTAGRTEQAHHLDQAVRAELEALYGGTRLGRQELGGELLEDIEGALWTQHLIDLWRLRPDDLPALGRVVVGVDPNAGGPDECGIVVAGLGAALAPDAQGRMQRHAYVLADYSGHYPNPGAWARQAVRAYHLHEADAVVAEVNNGGDMVGHVVRTEDPTVRYREVRATRGKAVRAEPVQGLYEQGRVHHVGALPRLEDQMTTWTPDADWSPDRLDALVWVCTDLLLRGQGGGRVSAA